MMVAMSVKHTISSFLTFSIVRPSELFGEHSKSEAPIISLELHVLQLVVGLSELEHSNQR